MYLFTLKSYSDKVRLLYDRSQTTARLVVRSVEDLEFPLVTIIIILYI